MIKVQLGEIRQIALAVKDIEVATAFYQNKLGLELLFRADPNMTFFCCEGIMLMLSEAKDVPLGGPILYFTCENIEATYAALEKAGVNVIRKPLLTHKTDDMELWLGFFDDPDGHTLALREEKAIKAG